MASLQEVKSRLDSITTTKKITKAMQLVATAKLKKARGNLEGIQEYYQAVYTTFQDLLGNVKDFSKIIPKTNSDSVLYIVITSDLGLCGSYNSNILKLVRENVKHTDKVFLIGSKGVANFKAKGLTPTLAFSPIGDDPNYDIASVICKDAIAQYLTGEIKEIRVLHTKFINTVTFETVNTKVLPVEQPTNKNTKEATAVTEFEPDAETVVRNAIPLYVTAVLFGAMVESKVSEMSSRRTAMENATENAEELIDKLDLQYNRMRQASITQEITEIIAGSESN